MVMMLADDTSFASFTVKATATPPSKVKNRTLKKITRISAGPSAGVGERSIEGGYPALPLFFQ